MNIPCVSIAFMLLCFLPEQIISQSDLKKQSIGEVKTMQHLDTITVWFFEPQLPQQLKRKITLYRTTGNWFDAQYEDSNHRIARRRVHAHRVKKFGRYFMRSEDKKKGAARNNQSEVVIQTSTFESQIFVNERNKHRLNKMLLILKMWK
jgi:hypothetical protein